MTVEQAFLGLNTILLCWLAARWKSYVDSYVAEKGKHLATKEDFEQLLAQGKQTTQATEQIRAEISGEYWVAQERWKLKKDFYSKVLEYLEELRGIMEWMRQPGEQPEEKTHEKLIRMNHLLVNIKRAAAVGALWLNQEALDAITHLFSLGPKLSATEDHNEQAKVMLEAYSETRKLLIEAGKTDLRL